VADEGLSAFSQKELARLAKRFTLMGEAAEAEARRESNAMAEYTLGEIRQAGYGRTVSGKAVRRVVDGAKVAKSSKTGRIDLGYVGQKFSGGGNTQILWGGLEFGTKNPKLKQFPNWSGRYGRGSRGWFIYPTLRKVQPELTRKWIDAFNRIVADWNK